MTCAGVPRMTGWPGRARTASPALIVRVCPWNENETAPCDTVTTTFPSEVAMVVSVPRIPIVAVAAR